MDLSSYLSKFYLVADIYVTHQCSYQQWPSADPNLTSMQMQINVYCKSYQAPEGQNYFNLSYFLHSVPPQIYEWLLRILLSHSVLVNYCWIWLSKLTSGAYSLSLCALFTFCSLLLLCFSQALNHEITYYFMCNKRHNRINK